MAGQFEVIPNERGVFFFLSFQGQRRNKAFRRCFLEETQPQRTSPEWNLGKNLVGARGEKGTIFAGGSKAANF